MLVILMKMIRAVWEKEMTPSQERTFIAPPIAVVREEKDDKVHRNKISMGISI